jgi:hypothetical protein
VSLYFGFLGGATFFGGDGKFWRMVALTSDLCLLGVDFIEGVFIERIGRLLDAKHGSRRLAYQACLIT